jgi:hypothetical protein
MFNNITNFFNLIANRKIKTAATIEDTDLIPLGTKDPTYLGGYQPTAITYQELVASIPLPVGGVQSVTGGTANSIVQVNNTDPSNPVIQINGVKYSNVLFVDAINPSPTPLQNRFDLPFDILGAMVTATTLTPTPTNRTLIYVRRGNYSGITLYLQANTDWYCEPGVVFTDTSITDNFQSVSVGFYGKAKFTGTPPYLNFVLSVRGASSKVYFSFDEVISQRAAFYTENGGSAIIEGRRVFTEAFASAAGSSFRGSGSVTMNVTEEISSWHQTILFKSLSGTVVITCPKIAISTGNYYGSFYKQVIMCSDNNAGGTCTINGNLVNNDTNGYPGVYSGLITRWSSDNMTLIVNGNLIAGDYWGIYGLGSSAGSRTIINGDVSTNHLVTYTQNASTLVFRNGTLINTQTYAGAVGFPVISIGTGSSIWVENCHMYSGGTGNAQNSAFHKYSNAATLNVYNSVYSGADATGVFIYNGGALPVNNARIHNCRSTKPLDVNVVDLLSPTGFIQDANIVALNFI